MTRQQRSKQSLKKWQKLISQQVKSGESVAAFCREHRLCAPQFYTWRKRLDGAETKPFVEVKVVPTAATSPAANDPAIEIHLGDGRCLRVRPGFDTQHLRAVLAVLEQQP
jgi:transposase-like protein